MDKTFNFNQERSIGEVISAGFQFFKLQFKPFMKFVLLYGGLPTVVSAIFYFIFMGDLFMSSMTESSMAYTDPFETIFSWAYLGNILFSIIAATAVPTAVFSYISLYAKSVDGIVQNEDFRRLFLRKLFPVLGSIILIYIAVLLGSMLLLIPGIYLAIVFSLVFIILIHEDLGVGSALSRSFEVIRGYWWQTFFLGVITSLMVLVVTYGFVLLIVGGLGFVVGSTGMNDATTFASIFAIVTGVITMAIYTFSSFLILIFIALQYFSLIEKNEAPSLNDRIEGITAEENQNV